MKTEDKFKKLGFIVVRGLVDTDEFYSHILKNMNRWSEDKFVPGSRAYYNNPKMLKLYRQLHPIVEEFIGLKLFKTYCYCRVYRTGSILRMHRDRPESEIGVTLNLGQEGKPWAIWMTDYDENPHKVVLNPGDAIIYHGSDLWHWRGKLVKGDYVGQLFMMFVDQNGPHAHLKNDPKITQKKK